jgi:RHS repeat-associated protein
VEYDPWGRVSRSVGAGDPSHRFTGQRLDDAATGLYYYGARYYDATAGRFVSADPIVPAPGNPQSLNRYAYVLNDPVNLTDPTGHFSIGKLFKKLFKAITKIIANADIEINVSSSSFSSSRGTSSSLSEGHRTSPALDSRRDEEISGDTSSSRWEGTSRDEDKDELLGGHAIARNEPRGSWQGPSPDVEWPTDGAPRHCDRNACGWWNEPRRHDGVRYLHDGLDAAGTRITAPPIRGAHGIAIGQGYNQGLLYTHHSGAYRALLIHVGPLGNILIHANPLVTPHAHIKLQQLQGIRWITVDPGPHFMPRFYAPQP